MNMDEDIAHVARVMAPSLRAFRGEPVLPPAYWRKRLQRIQDEFPLTQLQTFQIKHLLGELDRFEAERGPQHVPQAHYDYWRLALDGQEIRPKLLALRHSIEHVESDPK
ncbi:MAG TPA: hypothetical protein VHV99_10745 [Paraburkholderia sp.]|jgi:hypothetical protein|nr:hypothetical protein [Paraburkholderia sp.]